LTDCIFCRIAAKEISTPVVYEDEQALAFRDANPQAPSHALLIPKRHIANLAATTDNDAKLLGELMRTAARVAQMLGVTDSGYRVVANVGADGGQSVDHLHIHILGGRPLSWPPG
jgi:histidine triad (HIT) family protein